MSLSVSRALDSADATANSEAGKRRQVRKGTFSCWECKRRKTRCEFKQKSSSVCVTCQRRGTPCVGQDTADPAESSHVRVQERLVEVESLVGQLVQQRSTQLACATGLSIAENEDENNDFRDDIPVQTAVNLEKNINSPLPSLLATAHNLFPESRTLSSQLHSILPQPREAALILTRGKFSNLPIHVRGQSSRKTTWPITDVEKLAQVSKLPSPTVHPVHFACKLIQLALCLHQLDKPVYDVAERYVDIASRFVTSHDSLVDSIDGIETLMLESCYHINIGNIRSAWLVLRRALTIAQLIGLPLKTKEPDCREENVWFRLVLGDRSLSWMLGLPHAVIDNTFALERELAADAWSAKLERIHAVVFGQIVTRNVRMQRRRRDLDKDEDLVYDDCKVTQDIDHELKQASLTLPTNWWLCPNFNNKHMQLGIMEKTGKLITQMHHHYLLIVLHQPYIIRKSYPLPINDNILPASSPFDYSYSQIAVLSASREILPRFLVLRRFHRTLSYRGVDDKAFIAVMMFLLIYLNGHDLGRANVLDHQRPHDLAIINEVISVMEETSAANQDVLSTSMVQELKSLREIEAQSANGRSYFIWVDDTPVGKDSNETGENNDDLSLQIPYFGSVRIVRQEPERLRSSAHLEFDSNGW